jgi:hypothetical protein
MSDGDAVSEEAVEHAARVDERHHTRVFVVTSGVMIAAPAAAIAIGLVSLPIGVVAFMAALRASGRRRRARDVVRATRSGDRTWTLAGSTVHGRDDSGQARDIELALTPAAVRTLRALPAARARQPTSSIPPATER